MSNLSGAVFDVIKVANKEFAPHFKINKDYLDILLNNYCPALEKVYKDCYGMQYGIEVLDNTQTIKIEMYCRLVSLSKASGDWNSDFFQILKRCVSFGVDLVGQGENASLKLIFEFPSVWKGER